MLHDLILKEYGSMSLLKEQNLNMRQIVLRDVLQARVKHLIIQNYSDRELSDSNWALHLVERVGVLVSQLNKINSEIHYSEDLHADDLTRIVHIDRFYADLIASVVWLIEWAESLNRKAQALLERHEEINVLADDLESSGIENP